MHVLLYAGHLRWLQKQTCQREGSERKARLYHIYIHRHSIMCLVINEVRGVRG